MQMSTNRRELTLKALNLLNIKTRNSIHNSTKEIMISCPFHKDKTPSFGIDIENGRGHCFSCGWSGSIESLYKDVTGQSLKTVLGLKSDSFSSYSYRNSFQFFNFENPLTLKNVYLNFNTLDLKSLDSNPDVLAYLNNRGISLSIASSMKMKYIEESRINGTLFKRRLIIPVYENNRLISIEGRRIYSEDPDPKVLYPKNCTVNTLYDIDNLDKSSTLYACEGLMDLAVLRGCEFFKNSTSIFGANLTKRQIELFKQFPKVVYIYDLDEAGLSTVKQLKESELENIYTLKLPNEINNIKIKDIGDIPKTGVNVQYLLDRRWLAYIKPLKN